MKSRKIWIVAAAAVVILAGAAVVWRMSSKPAPEAPVIAGKAIVNIDGIIDEVGSDGKSFHIDGLWVTVGENTAYGITGPTAPDAEDQLVSDQFVVGNAVSGYTEDDTASGNVYALRIYNNFAPEAGQ
ncbi:MAG: hypothetical protein AAGU77_00235 [Bacillota bacterium]